jgi:hypothetical protein
MNETFSQVPECPDPAQLELFDCPAKDGDPVHSEVTPGPPAVILLQTRDPTHDKLWDNLKQSQKLLAESLYRKSRDLVSKSRSITDEEDRAKENEQPCKE